MNTIPVELLVVAALMTVAGLLTLWPAIRIVPDIVDLVTGSAIARQIGLLLLTVWVMLAVVGGGLIHLAWRMVRADRVARGLAHVLLGGLGGAILIGDQHTTELVLAMLGCFGAIAVLALSPNVDEFFAGVAAPDADQPAPVVMARTLIAVWAGISILVGLMFLPLGDLGGKFLPIGLLFVGLGAAAWYLNLRLATGDEQARLLVSTAAGVYLVLLLVLGERQPGLIIPIALVGGGIFNLWIPKESQAFFGTLPSPAT